MIRVLKKGISLRLFIYFLQDLCLDDAFVFNFFFFFFNLGIENCDFFFIIYGVCFLGERFFEQDLF